MDNTISTLYTPRITADQRPQGAGRTKGGGFLDLAQRLRDPSAPLDGGPALTADLTTRGSLRTDQTAAAEPPSLEEMLRAKYPRLSYHVFDASSGYWRTRNDYPHYLLYQQDIDTEAIENWQPTGPNPFYGSVDGKFMASKEIHALSAIPPGSKAVVIHPAVQARMEEDPAYAREIMERIDTYFAFDVARNEAILPGSTVGMNQAIAIGEDGSIVNVQASSSGGGRITRSGDTEDDTLSWWDLRMARHAYFMELLIQGQREDALLQSTHVSSGAAKAQLAQLLRNGNLIELLGDTIAGDSPESVLDLTVEQVWGAGALPL